jgi:hypothetical protein
MPADITLAANMNAAAPVISFTGDSLCDEQRCGKQPIATTTMDSPARRFWQRAGEMID